MHSLSSPIEQIKDHYTAVVVGSGYGGGIAASRLSRAGIRVCLLERGREILPGNYPDTEARAAKETQFHTAEGHLGSRLGLFDFHVNKEMNALVGCGLGGTSLINANVSLRAVPAVWKNPRWPRQVVDDLPTLVEEGYRHAEEMLTPQPYSEEGPTLPKLNALEKSAKAMGQKFYRPPINVTFKDGDNIAGVPQKACVNCGDCVSGCNYAAKNTTQMNYLPDAWNHGAAIFTEVAVRYLERKDGKWLVHYQCLGAARDVFDSPSQFVSADIVVLSAGTLGSTEILLRSRDKGLGVSDALGHGFTGNGDVLGFGYNCEDPINGIGFGTQPPGAIDPVGPTITGIIDHRDTPDYKQGYVIEEGSIPGALGGMLPATLGLAAGVFGREAKGGILDWVREKSRSAESLLLGPYKGAVHNTQTFLVMSHDGSDGQLRLENDRLRIVWPGVGEKPIYKEVNQRLVEATGALDGDFVENPIWSKVFHKSLITVHPLGGCGMAESAESGVVNHKGQVFSGAAGEAVYDSLYVADGAVMPCSLGVNPLLTISALAERTCALLARDRGKEIDYTLPSKPRQEPSAAAIGVQFTETMKGSISTEVKTAGGLPEFSDAVKAVYEQAEQKGKAADSPMEFILTIRSGDMEAMLESSTHAFTTTGIVSAKALSAQPLTVTEGSFNLFEKSPEHVDARSMIYRMKLTSEEGKSYFFQGFKYIDDSLVVELWPQTTTLYVTVYEGADASGAVVGQGVLHIAPKDFAKQLTTMKIVNAPNKKAQIEATARFGKFFAGVLYQEYGGIFTEPTVFNPDAPPREKRPLRVGAPMLYPFTTSDGVGLRLARYQGGSRGPVLLVHGAGVSSRIFSTDLIETNLLEYLYAHGYDVWLLDFRASIELPASNLQSNGDQVATIDHPEAVDYVRKITGAETIQAVVHCYGANTFFMAMLAGLKGVRSIVCSQIATDLITSSLVSFKSGLHTAGFLKMLGIDSLTAYVDTHADWKNRSARCRPSSLSRQFRRAVPQRGVSSHHLPVLPALRAQPTRSAYSRQPARTVRHRQHHHLRAPGRDGAAKKSRGLPGEGCLSAPPGPAGGSDPFYSRRGKSVLSAREYQTDF